MKDYQSHSELIEQYLLGELSTSEKSQLENELKQNAHLVQELEMQEALIGGVKQSRRAALKMRLQNLPTPAYQSKWYQQPLAKSLLISAGIALTIAGGTYLNNYLDSQPHPAIVQSQENAAQEENTGEDNPFDAMEKGANTKDSDIDNSTAHSKEGAKNKSNELGKTSKEEETNSTTTSETETQPDQPEIKAPEVPDFEDNSLKIKDNKTVDSKTPAEFNADKEVVQGYMVDEIYEQDAFEYSLNGRRIRLKGPFNGNYEIIEESSDSPTHPLILKFEGQRYVIEDTKGRFQKLKAVK